MAYAGMGCALGFAIENGKFVNLDRHPIKVWDIVLEPGQNLEVKYNKKTEVILQYGVTRLQEILTSDYIPELKETLVASVKERGCENKSVECAGLFITVEA